MKIFLFVFTFTLLASSVLLASPFIFEKEYVNYAWGYQHNGCLIDERGHVYKFDVQKGLPMTVTESLAKADELNFASKLLRQASLGTYQEVRAMCDAGSTTWKGNLNGEAIKLKSWGDLQGSNSAPESERLVQLIDNWCK